MKIETFVSHWFYLCLSLSQDVAWIIIEIQSLETRDCHSIAISLLIFYAIAFACLIEKFYGRFVILLKSRRQPQFRNSCLESSSCLKQQRRRKGERPVCHNRVAHVELIVSSSDLSKACRWYSNFFWPSTKLMQHFQTWTLASVHLWRHVKKVRCILDLSNLKNICSSPIIFRNNCIIPSKAFFIILKAEAQNILKIFKRSTHVPVLKKIYTH